MFGIGGIYLRQKYRTLNGSNVLTSITSLFQFRQIVEKALGLDKAQFLAVLINTILVLAVWLLR